MKDAGEGAADVGSGDWGCRRLRTKAPRDQLVIVADRPLGTPAGVGGEEERGRGEGGFVTG
ncbi:hypothetical protein A8M32_23790 [Sinorhizobium alkalisoli]|uniref:Uncharacterized protein n=1 Tax=Sinorhizobium alkalisoli TaxID=1752398 RepID=A0A1E3V5D8_9HYPH|nr:hypothetical protein A8M32_23790 [Sinorhizobium alkalisoli]